MPISRNKVLLRYGEQAAYDGLAVKDTNTIYFITDNKRIYVGEYEYTRYVNVYSIGDSIECPAHSFFLIQSEDSTDLYFTTSGTGEDKILISSLASIGDPGTYGPTVDTALDFSVGFKVPQIVIDSNGRISSITEKTLTLPPAPSIDLSDYLKKHNPTYTGYFLQGTNDIDIPEESSSWSAQGSGNKLTTVNEANNFMISGSGNTISAAGDGTSVELSNFTVGGSGNVLNFDVGSESTSITAIPASNIDVYGSSNTVELELENAVNSLINLKVFGNSNVLTTPTSDEFYCENSSIFGQANTADLRRMLNSSIEGQSNYVHDSMFASDVSGYSNVVNTDVISSFSTLTNVHVDGYSNNLDHSSNILDTYIRGGRNALDVTGVENLHLNGSDCTLDYSSPIGSMHIDGQAIYGSGTSGTVYSMNIEGWKNTVDNSASVDSAYIGGYQNSVDISTNINSLHVEGFDNTVANSDSSFVTGKRNAVISGYSSFIAGAENVVENGNNVNVSGYKNTVYVSDASFANVFGAFNSMGGSGCTNLMLGGYSNAFISSNSNGLGNVLLGSRSTLNTPGDNNFVHGGSNYLYAGASCSDNCILGSSNNFTGGSINYTSAIGMNLKGSGSSISKSYLFGADLTLSGSVFEKVILSGLDILVSGQGATKSMFLGSDNTIQVGAGSTSDIAIMTSGNISGSGFRNNIFAGSNQSILGGPFYNNAVLGSGCTMQGSTSYSTILGPNMAYAANYSVVSGYKNSCQSEYSFVTGVSNISLNPYSFIAGKYSTVDSEGDYAFILGNGSDTTARSSMFGVTWDGDLKISGDVYADCDSTLSDGVKLAKIASEVVEIESDAWEEVTGADPFTYKADVELTTVVGEDDDLEIVNNQAVLFRTYGFSISGIEDQVVTIYSIGAPTSDVSLKIRIWK